MRTNWGREQHPPRKLMQEIAPFGSYNTDHILPGGHTEGLCCGKRVGGGRQNQRFSGARLARFAEASGPWSKRASVPGPRHANIKTETPFRLTARHQGANRQAVILCPETFPQKPTSSVSTVSKYTGNENDANKETTPCSHQTSQVINTQPTFTGNQFSKIAAKYRFHTLCPETDTGHCSQRRRQNNQPERMRLIGEA